MKKCLKKKNNNFTSVQSIGFAVMEAKKKKKTRSIMWLQTKIIWKGSPSTRKMACATILGKGGEMCAGKLCVCGWVGWGGGGVGVGVFGVDLVIESAGKPQNLTRNKKKLLITKIFLCAQYVGDKI